MLQCLGIWEASPECTKIAHRRSLAIFAADSGIAGYSAVGIQFVPFNRRENRRSLAIFFAEEIAHLGASKIARFCGGAVKIAAATAENRAILVHSEPTQQESSRSSGKKSEFLSMKSLSRPIMRKDLNAGPVGNDARC